MKQILEASAALMAEVRLNADLNAFDQLRSVAWPYLKESTRRHLDATSLAFDASEIVSDSLAKMLLERGSFDKDFAAFADQTIKSTITEIQKRVGRVLVREHKAFELVDSGSNDCGEVSTADCLGENILADAWAGLPEGSRRTLKAIQLDSLRYSVVSDGDGGIDSTGPPKVRRMRERLRELSRHLVERTDRLNTMCDIPSAKELRAASGQKQERSRVSSASR